MIDNDAKLTVFNMEQKELLELERKDAWRMQWSEENPGLLCVMEKTKLCTYLNLEAEEPEMCSGYICQHKDLHVTAILMDEILQHPTATLSDKVIQFETKTLRDMRELVQGKIPCLVPNLTVSCCKTIWKKH